MTEIYLTCEGILQQKESGKVILVTQNGSIVIEKMKRRIDSQETADEVAKAIVETEKRFSGIKRW